MTVLTALAFVALQALASAFRGETAQSLPLNLVRIGWLASLLSGETKQGSESHQGATSSVMQRSTIAASSCGISEVATR